MLGLPNSFEMVDTLAPPDARQDQALFILPIVWDDDCNRLANYLLGRVAEYALRTSIPTCDHAIEVLADNCIVTGFDDRCQRTQPLFTVAKFRLEVPAVRDVDSRGVQERYRSRLVKNGVDPKINDPLAAVG